MPAEDFVSLDGLQIHYQFDGPENPESEGDSSPVVLLHGGGLDAAGLSWKETLPRLAADSQVYAPDWPGYGDSDPPDDSPSVSYYVSVLRRFLDALDLETVRLVGLSMGGAAALGFALEYPERVERLVAVDSYGLGGRVPGGPLGALFTHLPGVSNFSWTALSEGRWLISRALAGIVARGNLTDSIVADARTELERPRAGKAWSAFQQNEVGFGGLKTDYTDRLSELRVPTLFVHGEDDPLVPTEWSTRAADLAPDASVVVLDDCGHWPPRETPEEFVRVIRPFLAG